MKPREAKIVEPNGRCKAMTKSGKPCNARPMEGGICFLHANPNKAVELGRRGGRSNRRGVVADTDVPLPALDTALSVRETVARWVMEVYTGKLHPRKAAGLAPLTHLLLRAIETVDTEELKKQIAELREQMGVDAEPQEIFRRASRKLRRGQSTDAIRKAV